MDVADVLDFSPDGIGELERPVLLVGLEGWFDAGGAATNAIETFVGAPSALVVAEIDPDPFYDFTQQRPMLRYDNGAPSVSWPTNEVIVQRNPPGDRDVVALIGVEPHLHWNTYVAAILDVGDRLGCEAVVTVGSAAEALPHTRIPPVTGSTANPELARALGLAKPSYQGMTGIAGVLTTELEARGLPAISLRVGIPHYLLNAEHPLATATLAHHLGHVLRLDVGIDLSDDIASWREVHDEVVEGDDELRMYVAMLEAEFDRRAEAAIPTGDDLARNFEQFFREFGDGD